jgi:ketosteroid isomerase-like protein
MQNQMIENLDQYIHLEMLSGYLPGMDEALMARLFGLDPVLASFVTDGGMPERSSGRAAAQGASASPYPQRLLVCVTQFGKIDLLRGEMDARGRQVEEFVREWAAAEQRGDAAFLEGALTDDFVGVGPLDFMLNKEQWVRRFAGGLSYESFALDEVEPRFYGEAAVATCRQRQAGGFQGNDVGGEFRVTLVFAGEEDRWLLAGTRTLSQGCRRSWIAETCGFPGSMRPRPLPEPIEQKEETHAR